jgi:hypothetical protein
MLTWNFFTVHADIWNFFTFHANVWNSINFLPIRY